MLESKDDVLRYGCWMDLEQEVDHPYFADRIIENSSGIWRGDIQEQRGPFEACGSAAYRG